MTRGWATGLAVAAALAGQVAAESQERRLELGAFGSGTRLGSFYDTTSFGFGLRLGWRAGGRWALEGDVATLPQDADLTLRGGRKLQAFLGPRIGFAAGRAELFVRARPGFVRFGEGRPEPETACILIFPPPGGCALADTRLALDLGGGVAWSASERLLLRLDVGDTLSRFNDDSYRFGEDDGRWLHSPQLSLGASVRF
jgi:hypothetical protein